MSFYERRGALCECIVVSRHDLAKGKRLANFAFQQDQRRWMVLRGGTPANLGHDLPPNAIQLTRTMLFAACVHAVDETKPGCATFSPVTQAEIESHWRDLQG